MLSKFVTSGVGFFQVGGYVVPVGACTQAVFFYRQLSSSLRFRKVISKVILGSESDTKVSFVVNH